MKGRRSRSGQVAVFDVVLFLPLVLIALFFLQSAFSVRSSFSQEMTDGSRYGTSALTTLLAATVPETKTYLGLSGAVGSAQDWNVRSLLLWYVYLVSCQTATSAELNNGGWMGWSINQTALAIATGAAPPSLPTTFLNYYLQFNGTAKASSCQGLPVPVHILMGEKPQEGTTDVYTADNVLIPPALPGEGNVSVVMGVWEQS